MGLKHYWLVKIHPEFIGCDEVTKEKVAFRNWRENVIDVYAESEDQAKETAAITGLIEGEHYNDIIEEKD